MQLHQLKPKHKMKKKKRVGRGGKRGTYAGRGDKGQRSRAGKRMQPVIREFIKRYPKLRGYKFKPKDKFLAKVNLAQLDDKFKDGDLITPQSLIKNGLVSKIKGRVPEVKILAKGEITKGLKIKSCQLSQAAKQKITKAGGSIN